MTKFLIFSHKKLFLYFRKRNLLIFQENILGKGNPKKRFHISEKNFKTRKMKKANSKKVSYISGDRTLQPYKT